MICTQCCGSKRVIEINCPPDCQYLTDGHQYHTAKKYSQQILRESDPVRARRYYGTLNNLEPELRQLELEILRYAGELSSLGDDHVLEAVRLARKTYETEERGIILAKQRHPNPLVESLADELQRACEDLRIGSDEAAALRLEDVLDCLDALALDVEFHIDNQGGSYLDFITRNHPEESRDLKPSRIIQL